METGGFQEAASADEWLYNGGPYKLIVLHFLSGVTWVSSISKVSCGQIRALKFNPPTYAKKLISVLA